MKSRRKNHSRFFRTTTSYSSIGTPLNHEEPRSPRPLESVGSARAVASHRRLPPRARRRPRAEQHRRSQPPHGPSGPGNARCALLNDVLNQINGNYQASLQVFVSVLIVCVCSLTPPTDHTDPQLHTFRSEEYGKFLYDRMKSKFYHFSYEMWYSGIDTAKIRPEDKSVHTGCCSRYASSVPVVARDLYSHCEHFLQDDFWFDLADPDPDSKVDRRKAWKALLSKYRKDCAYCVPCKAQ
jgi:hypothetical protein